MKEITIKNKEFILKGQIIDVLEREIKIFGTLAKAGIPKRYIGKRAHILILDD